MTLAEDTGTQAPHVTLPCPACGRWNRIAARRMTDGPKCGVCAAPLNLSHPITLTDATFDRVIRETSLPILVDFYADWCGPCRMMAPTLDDFAQKRAGEALVLKLDTEANPQTAQRFGIRGIPTLIAFEGGKERGRHVGLADMKVLEGLAGVS